MIKFLRQSHLPSQIRGAMGLLVGSENTAVSIRPKLSDASEDRWADRMLCLEPKCQKVIDRPRPTPRFGVRNNHLFEITSSEKTFDEVT